MSIIQSFNDFAPTKTMLAWTAAGASVLTMALGFTVGGWVTGGSATEMAAEAAESSHADLASRICATNFALTDTARAQREEMLELTSYRQRGFVQEQPWALMPGDTEVSRQVADLCAERIAEMEPAVLAARDDTAVPLDELAADPG